MTLVVPMTAAVRRRSMEPVAAGLGLAVVAALGALIAVDLVLALVAASALLVPAVLAVPVVRSAVLSPVLLPLLVAAPTAISVYPAIAVPLTTGLLCLVLAATPGERLPPAALAAVGCAAAVGVAGVVVGLAGGATPTAIAGDALQFAGFYLAAVVAFRRDLRLLSTRSLAGLSVAMVLVSLANALGRVDFLAAAGSDIQRNINFLAPVVLIWGLVHVLWGRPTPAALGMVGVAGMLTLLTFTRGMWAGAGVGCLLVVFWYLSARAPAGGRFARLGAAAALALVGAAGLQVVAPAVVDIASAKVASLFHRDVDYTYQQRGFETQAVMSQRGEAPFGRGFGADYVVPSGGTVTPGPRHYIHNQYAAQLFRNGAAGTALTAVSLLLLVRLRRGGPGSAAALGTLGYVLVTGLTSPALFTYPTNLLAGLAVGSAVWIDGRAGRDR